MAHETRISPEIEANPDWAAAVRQADGWVARYLRQTTVDGPVEWTVRPDPVGESLFAMRMVIGLDEVRAEFRRGDLDDRWSFTWRVSQAWREANMRGIREEFAGIKRVLREWADELRAEEQTVAAEN